jgi:hypothetical protein
VAVDKILFCIQIPPQDTEETIKEKPNRLQKKENEKGNEHPSSPRQTTRISKSPAPIHFHPSQLGQTQTE